MLNTASRSLLRDGEHLSLQPKAYEVLLLLVENNTRLITRDELMDSVWGTDVNVGEGALTYQINQLRNVLGDDASQPRYIKTIPKLGFQFVGSVRALTESEELGEAISATPASDPEIEPTRGEAGHNNALFAGMPRLLGSSFAGHGLYVIFASAIYAAYFGVALLVEIAYQFDRYGSAGKSIATAISGFIFLSSLLALSLGTKRTLSSRSGGLVLSGAVLVVAAAAAFIGACRFLPAEPITLAKS